MQRRREHCTLSRADPLQRYPLPRAHHLAADPGNRFLFAATTTHLRSFAIDPRTGGQLMQPWTLTLFSCHLVYFIGDSPYKIY